MLNRKKKIKYIRLNKFIKYLSDYMNAYAYECKTVVIMKLVKIKHIEYFSDGLIFYLNIEIV